MQSERREPDANENPYSRARLNSENTKLRAEITRLTEALRAAEEREKALRGIANGFIGLVISSGLTEDLVAQVFPDMKRKNGQPASTFAKNARRMVNEARQALAGAKP